jgi:hypothetical protein
MISYNKFNNENMKKNLTLSLLLIGSTGLKSQTSDTANKIDSIVKVYVTKETPGCVVGVVKDGKIVGFVIADVGRLKNIEFTKKNEVIQIL